MKSKLRIIALFVFSLTACSKNDGDWDGIKWSDSQVTFSAQGGTRKVHAKNYSSVWINGMSEEGSQSYIHAQTDTLGYDTYCEGPWAEAGAKGNVITVTVAPNNTTATRTMIIDGESGDAFGQIKITQLPNNK